MIIDPADDEINIILPIAFFIFVGIILVSFGIIVSLIYVVLKELKVIEGKLLTKVLSLVKSRIFSK